MSNPDSALPSFTGNPVLDTALRSFVMVLGGIASTMLTAYLTRNGISDTAILTQVPLLVTTLLSAVATLAVAIWSVYSKRNTVAALVDHATEAAVTGQIPQAVKALANPMQAETIAIAGK